MKPKPLLTSTKASIIPTNWEKTLDKNGSFIIHYLDESLNRLESKYSIIEEENKELRIEVEQLRRTVYRMFNTTK